MGLKKKTEREGIVQPLRGRFHLQIFGREYGANSRWQWFSAFDFTPPLPRVLQSPAGLRT